MLGLWQGFGFVSAELATSYYFWQNIFKSAKSVSWEYSQAKQQTAVAKTKWPVVQPLSLWLKSTMKMICSTHCWNLFSVQELAEILDIWASICVMNETQRVEQDLNNCLKVFCVYSENYQHGWITSLFVYIFSRLALIFKQHIVRSLWGEHLTV